MGYVELGYKPGKDDLVCKYFLEPALNFSMGEAVELVDIKRGIETRP
ncbi:MAG: hypothetical protein JXB14_00380 [Candidatus Altiarchaeota archaeon]|nr:hypothetical protein [Candidatus Altiarchaeota archaeon]